jgi:hypothetical protein
VIVEVPDNGLGHVSQASTGGDPPGAELAVFRGRKGCVEPAQLVECLARDNQIVGGEKTGSIGFEVEFAVPDVEHELAGLRIPIARERVDRMTTKSIIGVLEMALDEKAKPRGVRSAIVVGESKELPAGQLRSHITSPGLSAMGNLDQLHVECFADGIDPPTESDSAAVVDHDDLEAVMGIVKPDERIETLREPFRPSVRGYDE